MDESGRNGIKDSAERRRRLSNRVWGLIYLVRPFTILLPVVAGTTAAFMGFASLNAGEALPFFYINSSYPFLQSREGILTLLEGVAALAFVFAGYNALNSVYDEAEDRVNKPDLPIPRGLLRADDAYSLAWLFYLLGLFRSFFVNRAFSGILLVIVVLTVLYSIPPVRLKKRLILSNLVLSMTHGLLLFAAGWSIFGDPAHPLPWTIGLILAVYLFGTITTKDFSDAGGDSESGIRTLVTALGDRGAAAMTAPFFFSPFILVAVLVWTGHLPHSYLGILALSLWAGLAAFELRGTGRERRALHGNIPSWTHMNLLLMAMLVGFCVIYLYG